MSDIWEEILQEASLAGIEFPLKSRSFSGGRDAAKTRFPHMPGQMVEDTGRVPYSFKLEIELYADVDESHYPGKYQELLALFEDDRVMAEVEFVDPVLGQFNVKMTDFSVEEDSETRNGARLTISLEEVTWRFQYFFQAQRLASPRARLATSASEADVALEEAGVTDEAQTEAFNKSGYPLKGFELDWPAGGKMLAMADAFLANIESGVATVERIRGNVDETTARIVALTREPELRVPSGWSAMAALYTTLNAAASAAEEKSSLQKASSTYTVPAETSVRELALLLLGDPSRAPEITAQNSIRNPNAIPSGTVLLVPQR